MDYVLYGADATCSCCKPRKISIIWHPMYYCRSWKLAVQINRKDVVCRLVGPTPGVSRLKILVLCLYNNDKQTPRRSQPRGRIKTAACWGLQLDMNMR